MSSFLVQIHRFFSMIPWIHSLERAIKEAFN